MSQINSLTVHLYATQSLTPIQSLPHLSPIRSIQWRDNTLLIVETTDNDLYAYIQSTPTKFEPWTIYVSPSLLRSFWLGPSTTDLLLRRALSDSNYLFHQNNPLSSLIATRRYESVSQISQLSRDLILNISSDGYHLSINAINDTSHSTSNYIRSSPIVQLRLNEYIPNDITDIRIMCNNSHSPIYILALRGANRGLLVGVLNPASIFDPVPDTSLHPPIQWLRNTQHVQHTHGISVVSTDALGNTLSTYSEEDGKLIHWHVVDTPSNAMHKLRIIESVASFEGVEAVHASIHVHNVSAIAFKDRVEVYRGGSLVKKLPTKASSVLFTNTSTHIHIIERHEVSVAITWLVLSSCDVVHRETISTSPIRHLAIASNKHLIKSNIPSYKSRTRTKSVTPTQDLNPVLTMVDENVKVMFVEIRDSALHTTEELHISYNQDTHITAVASCAHSRHTAVVASDSVRIYNCHNILELEYTPDTSNATAAIRDIEYLSLPDYEDGLLLLVNESAFVRIWISTHDPARRWVELTRLTLPAYECSGINSATFLRNGTVALVTDANVHIQSVLHFLSTSLSVDVDGCESAESQAVHKPLRQLSIYEVVADIAGPVQEWHPVFMTKCIDLGWSAILKSVLRRLKHALVHCDTGGLHNAFICGDEEEMQCEEEDRDTKSRYPFIDDQFIDALSTLKGVVGESAYESVSDIIKSIQKATDTCINADEYAWKAVYYATLTHFNHPHPHYSHITLFALLSHNQQLISDALPNDAATLLTYPSIWLPDDAFQRKMEIIAKKMSTNADDAIDPNRYGVSVVYFALKKKSAVLTLWKYTYGHKERDSIVRFLSKDFDGDGEQSQHNRVAATKNAYALLSKHRYDYAAAFFVLAHKHADAVRVLIKHCRDYELALCVARLSGNTLLYDGVLKDVANWALQHGDTALVVAALLKLGHKMLASKCLVDLESMVQDDFFADAMFCQALDLDVALVGLYNTSNAIPKAIIKSEGKVALRCANQLARDGCHALAVKLLSDWKFGEGVKEKVSDTADNANTTSQTQSDTDSHTTTQPPQPKTNIVASQPKQSSQHVDQFDMSAFGF